jgi:signal transduction histidine kinase
MLIAILSVALAVAVALLITLDVVKSAKDPLLAQPEWHAQPTDHAPAGAPRDAAAHAFGLEPAGTSVSAIPQDLGRAGRSDGATPPAASHRRPEAWSAALPKGASGGLKNWPVRTRLFLLAVIAAVGAAVIVLSAVRMVVSLRSTAMHSPVSSVKDGAIVAASVAGVVLAVVLLVAIALMIIVARSVLKPLHRLQAGAVEVAEVRLPETMHLISEGDGEDGAPAADPIKVDSADEMGDVARAFDRVYGEALRLAANEAAIRGKLNTIFVNLSRRSQSLVDRQIRLIDDLEQGEQQPERRANLYKLDHLVTRMRRYSQNLLILAGHETSVQPSPPMAMLNVIRVAVSEIEEYERVSLNVQPGIAVSGLAVNDVVHILAELAENATALSAADTPVLISGRMLASGGFLIDITDRGFGMSSEEMAHANWRLDNPPTGDITVFKSMGLSVVARLASRHGIRIRLRQADSGGLTALVWLPNAVLLQQQEQAAPPSFSRSRPEPPAPAAPAAQPVSARHGRFFQVESDRAPVE